MIEVTIDPSQIKPDELFPASIFEVDNKMASSSSEVDDGDASDAVTETVHDRNPESPLTSDSTQIVPPDDDDKKTDDNDSVAIFTVVGFKGAMSLFCNSRIILQLVCVVIA